jgi:hypothetical protein
MIRFEAMPPAEKPVAKAAAKTATPTKAAKSAPEKNLLDLAADTQDDKD